MHDLETIIARNTVPPPENREEWLIDLLIAMRAQTATVRAALANYPPSKRTQDHTEQWLEATDRAITEGEDWLKYERTSRRLSAH